MIGLGGRGRRIVAALTVAILLAESAGVARADSSQFFSAYTVDARGTRLPIPQPYVRDLEISGLGTEAGPFKDPKGIFVDSQGDLYIADSGHDRVLSFDPNGKLTKIYGKSLGLSEPEGVFVTPRGEVFIADTGNGRIIDVDRTGQVVRQFKKPTSPLLAAQRSFRPAKLVVDRRGYLYVLEEGSTAGIMVLDTDGNFRGYFGATRLQFDLRWLLINLVATREQKRQILEPEPVPHSDMYLTPDGFLYTAVATTTIDQIQKLNPVGVNIFRPSTEDHQFFGEIGVPGARLGVPGFVAVTVDRFGVVSAIDQNSARIYQYDQSRRLLMAFGGPGFGREQFDVPAAIATDDRGRLYVLDTGREVVYRLRPSRFTQLIHQASQLYFDGQYAEAAQLWNEVLRYDNQYEIAHAGIGRALFRQENYPAAMAEFQRAFDRDGYSQAFEEYRYNWLRANFAWLVIAAALILATFGFFGGVVRRLVRGINRRTVGGAWPFELRTVYGILRHPEDTLWDLRESGSLWAVPILVGLACVVRIGSLWLLAFHMLANPTLDQFVKYLSPFNVITYYYLQEVDPDQINVLIECLHVLAPWIAWVIVSYGVGVIFAGEASFRAVLKSSAYCLVPYILLTLPIYAFSHVLVRDDLALFHTLISITYLWCAFLFFLQVKVIHDLAFGQTARMLIGNLFGMCVLFGFLGLIYLVTSQMLRFAWEVLYEISTL
jgi:DNA-binding beta-propeller fold protein YncE